MKGFNVLSDGVYDFIVLFFVRAGDQNDRAGQIYGDFRIQIELQNRAAGEKFTAEAQDKIVFIFELFKLNEDLFQNLGGIPSFDQFLDLAEREGIGVFIDKIEVVLRLQ